MQVNLPQKYRVDPCGINLIYPENVFTIDVDLLIELDGLDVARKFPIDE